MARRSRWAALAGAVVLVLGLGEAPGFAVQAGQFCATAAANTITVAENGATVQCQYNPNSDRYQWVAVTTTTTAATTTTLAGPATETRIISITQTPVSTTVPIATGLLERTG